MSRKLALAIAATLLSLAACNKPSEETTQPAAVQPAPQTSMAPQPAQPAAPAEPAATPESTMAPAINEKTAEATTAKPVEPKPAAPTATTAPAKPAEAPVAKPMVSAAPTATTLTQEQALALAAKGNCLACHKIDSRLVGPAWKDVGAKYKGDANAAATIAAHIKTGGSFGWKFGVMPPRGGSQLSDADVDSLARFIASLR